MSRPPTHTDSLIDALDSGEAVAQLASYDERRAAQRIEYAAYVGLLLVSPTGEQQAPLVLRARDLSLDGLSVIGRRMIHPGAGGALQLVRSDGRAALIGVEVKYCVYVGRMEHATGLLFAPLPLGLTRADFLDMHGRMPLFDKRLLRNYEDGGGP